MGNKDNILAQALKLSEKDRAEVAESLLQSLDPETEEEIAEVWDKEIRRRLKSLDSGKAKTLSWDEVRRRLMAL